MIITKPRDWERIIANLDEVGATRVFIMGCGQCATVAKTGGEDEVHAAAEKLVAAGREVTGWAIGEVACHEGGTRLTTRKNSGSIESAEAVLVLSCGAGVQTVADATPGKAVFPGLESAFLGNVVRSGVFEERCQMCGECVLDLTAGICPVTTCPKGLLNGPCGGMWEGKCEVVTDRECTHVLIRRRLEAQGRGSAARAAAGAATAAGGAAASHLPPKDFSKKLKPGKVNLREDRR